MSSAFLGIVLLPLVPLVLGLVLIVHLTATRHVPLEIAIRSFAKKVLSWGAIGATAFAAFVIIFTAATDSPQGPLMLLFISVPFALGEFTGLISWAWSAYAT